jgi:membrane associated rhomboid family serine protease
MYEREPKLTYFLISFCISIYFLELILSEKISWVFQNFGLSLKALLEGKFWTFLTSIFLHASPEHLIMNMLALYFFGKVVEEALGKKKFIIVFFLSALCGNVVVISLSLIGIQHPLIPTVGASGAIFGLMAVAMLIKPLEFIFYPYLLPIPLFLVAFLYTLYNVIYFVAILTTNIQTEIAYGAHIGGMLYGLYFGLKEEKSKRGIIIIVSFLFLLIFVPLVWSTLENMEALNYLNIFLKAIK